MSAARTFTEVSADYGTTPPTAFVAGKRLGYQRMEYVRQSLGVNGYCGFHADFGGSEDVGIITGAATWVAVRGRRRFTLNGDSFGGLTLEAVVSYKTSNAATSVQVRVRNVSDGSNAALGTASVSTTVVDETLTLTLASGDKIYELEVLGDATYPVYGWGNWRLRKVPT